MIMSENIYVNKDTSNGLKILIDEINDSRYIAGYHKLETPNINRRGNILEISGYIYTIEYISAYEEALYTGIELVDSILESHQTYYEYWKSKVDNIDDYVEWKPTKKYPWSGVKNIPIISAGHYTTNEKPVFHRIKTTNWMITTFLKEGEHSIEES